MNKPPVERSTLDPGTSPSPRFLSATATGLLSLVPKGLEESWNMFMLKRVLPFRFIGFSGRLLILSSVSIRKGASVGPTFSCWHSLGVVALFAALPTSPDLPDRIVSSLSRSCYAPRGRIPVNGYPSSVTDSLRQHHGCLLF